LGPVAARASKEKEKEKMFFHIVLERNMQLHPRHFGRNLRENLVAKLMKDVEGTCRSGTLKFFFFFFFFVFGSLENLVKANLRKLNSPYLKGEFCFLFLGSLESGLEKFLVSWV
jgi:hypothetical protein